LRISEFTPQEIAENNPILLSLVIPTYKERDNIENVVNILSGLLDKAIPGNYELIIVDDDSPDRTWEIAQSLISDYPQLRVMRRQEERGLSSAVIRGWQAATGRVLGVIDGDLQHDETLLPRMLEALEAGQADIVIGSRNIEGGDKQGGLTAARQMISDAGAALANAALPVRVNDPMSGFFALPRAVFEELAPRLTGTGFKILLDILLSAQRPLQSLEIPYSFRARVAGESKLDAGVILEFAGLLADKALGGVVPLRFLSFAAVGAIGVLVHLAVLGLLHGLGGVGFNAAQWAATFAAMTANFLLNNRITYRDRRLRGPALMRGLVVFYLVCGLGAAANIGIANLLLRDGVLAWGFAGAAGAALTVVWNYAVSATLVWRAK
jgi:dolichol-phosphate mannosyltransferase